MFLSGIFLSLQINSSRDVESKVREKLWDISGSNTCGVKGQAEVKGRGDGNSFSSLNSRLPTQGITTTATIGLDIDPEPDVDQRMSVGSDSPCSRLVSVSVHIAAAHFYPKTGQTGLYDNAIELVVYDLSEFGHVAYHEMYQQL